MIPVIWPRSISKETSFSAQIRPFDVRVACADEEIRIEVRTRYRHLWELVERLTGLPFDEVVQFFAMGMLLNVGAALDLRGVDERWAEWCGTDTAKTDVPTA